MTDEAVVIDLVGKAWDETDMDPSAFADLLAAEAERYRECACEARSPHRTVPEGWAERVE